MPLLPFPFLCVLVPFKNKHFVMLASFISGYINDYLMAYVTLALWLRVYGKKRWGDSMKEGMNDKWENH